MRDLKISLCHYPTTVVFVDDNTDYLMALRGKFNELLPYHTFSDPTAALKYLNETYQEEPFIRRCTTTPIDAKSNQFESKVDLNAIQNEITRPKRFSEIAVVVADYTMPRMNGLEFCQQIKNPNILTILLTGEAQVNTVITAFNNGIIDGYLQKAISNTTDVLHEAIRKLERQYFIKLSNIIINQANPDNLACLEDREVAEQFYKLCQQHDIAEHYIISEKGDFLLIDKEGEPSWLTIKSDDEMQSIYQYADISGLSNSALQALKNREQIPLFFAANDPEPDPIDWENYFSPAQPISHSKRYYYAYKRQGGSKDLGKIVSYLDYLANA